MKPTITLHRSICDATPGMCAHDWQCRSNCPGKPARYSAQGKHADTLRQRIQAQHGLPPHHAADPQANPQAIHEASDEAADRATAPVPSADEAFAGLDANGDGQLTRLESLGQTADKQLAAADLQNRQLEAIGFQQRQLDSIWQRLGGAWQGIAPHLR